MTNNPFPLSSISSGTLRPEDLIPTFANFLEPGSELAARAKAYNPNTTSLEEASWLVEDLIEALNEMAPPYYYFSPADDDLANFGFWINLPAINADLASGKLRKVADLSEIPASYNGRALLIDDENNNEMSLYAVKDGIANKIWSVV